MRMLGVDGLDRSGKPLAAQVVERFCGDDPACLARGIVLPFVVAMLEYDMPARELALDVASGHVDLVLESELLDRPERREAAVSRARETLASTLARFDENRTAAHDMRDVLGMPDEPWLGIALKSAEVEAAAAETRAVIRDGADLVRIRVPASWELAQARRAAGLEVPGRVEASGVSSGHDARDSHNSRNAGRNGRPGGGADRGRSRSGRAWTARGRPLPPSGSEEREVAAERHEDEELVPAGSERGLEAVRAAADRAAAERRCYASLVTITSAFAAPEQAVVAASQRIDFVEADPIREIVEDNVDPERALADHAFAHRLHARAGTRVVMGGGALALGADVALGIPADAATRAGRSLALQALGVELALADGLPADRLLLGALPGWIAGERDARASLVQAWLRHRIFPDHRLVLEQDADDRAVRTQGSALVTAITGGRASIVIRDHAAGKVADFGAELRAAMAAGSAIRAALGDGRLYGDAEELAARTLREAELALRCLDEEGWVSLLGPEGEETAVSLGRTAIVDRAPDSGTARLLLAEL